MEEYRIIRTETAIGDADKALSYMEQHGVEPERGQAWYEELDQAMNDYLRDMPDKFVVCHTSERTGKEYRKFPHKTTVVIYSVDEKQKIVYIHMISPKGKDWVSRLDRIEN